MCSSWHWRQICHWCHLYRCCTFTCEYLCEFSTKFEMTQGLGGRWLMKKPEAKNLVTLSLWIVYVLPKVAWLCRDSVVHVVCCVLSTPAPPASPIHRHGLTDNFGNFLRQLSFKSTWLPQNYYIMGWIMKRGCLPFLVVHSLHPHSTQSLMAQPSWKVCLSQFKGNQNKAPNSPRAFLQGKPHESRIWINLLLS